MQSDELLAQLKTRVLEADKEKKVATIGDVMRLGTSHRNNAPAGSWSPSSCVYCLVSSGVTGGCRVVCFPPAPYLQP